MTLPSTSTGIPLWCDASEEVNHAGNGQETEDKQLANRNEGIGLMHLAQTQTDQNTEI